ncbi:peptidyl-prolyl cis-trans isomerase [Paenibacillus larvae subsp. larvae]|nr:peptidylprolyl isomerase [Paenibacillus larvae]AVF21001.1 peptidyl-prolyl cis-trans isomerase [Paenibacillus larvae subsp. larvae]
MKRSERKYRMFHYFLLALTVILILSACNTGKKDEKGAGEATPSSGKTWSKPPEMAIDTNKTYTAKIETGKGDFVIELFSKDAPKTVNNFVFLAKEGFYNNVKFHRIIKPFMIQTGDPSGTGTGGPGYTFEDELNTAHTYEPGIVAMANRGPNTNGSQFFICTGEQAKGLNKVPNYTIFGRVKDGMDVVNAIADTPVKQNPNSNDSSPSMPTEDVIIKSVTITES